MFAAVRGVFSGSCTHHVSLSWFSPGLIYCIHRDTQRYRQRLIGLRCTSLFPMVLACRSAKTHSEPQFPHEHTEALFTCALCSDSGSEPVSGETVVCISNTQLSLTSQQIWILRSDICTYPLHEDDWTTILCCKANMIWFCAANHTSCF